MNTPRELLGSFEAQILAAVVEGYTARAGMKERLQALSEWEIARRAGYTDASYAEYARHPAREKLARALDGLEAAGLIAIWARGGLYDSFVPTEAGVDHPAASPRAQAALRSDEGTPTGSVDQQILHRLDEIIQLLRAIDARLSASPRTGPDPRL